MAASGRSNRRRRRKQRSRLRSFRRWFWCATGPTEKTQKSQNTVVIAHDNPRFVRPAKPNMQPQSEPKPADIISDFHGLYARVARKLGVSPSMVSRVARGNRKSLQIERALREEFIGLKAKLDDHQWAR